MTPEQNQESSAARKMMSGETLGMALFLVIVFGSSLLTSPQMLEIAAVTIALSGIFAFLVLKKHYLSHSIINLTCLLPALAMMLYFAVSGSALADIGLVYTTLAGINTLLCLNFWMQRPPAGGFHFNTLGAFVIVAATLVSLNLAISEGNLSLPMLQGILAASTMALLAHFGGLLTKKFRDGIRQKPQFLLLSLPNIFLSFVGLVFPNLTLPVLFTIAAIFGILAYHELSKQTDTIHSQIQSKNQYTNNNSLPIEQFDYQLRTSLDIIINRSENFLESSGQSPHFLNDIVSESKRIVEHWQVVFATHQLLASSNQKKTEFTPRDLITIVTKLHPSPSGRLEAIVPNTFPKINSNPYTLAFVIHSLIDKVEFTKVTFKFHFYNTISNGMRFANIDIRGFTNDLKILDRPNSFRPQKKSMYTVQEDICQKLGGGFIDKSLRASVPFYTIYLPLQDEAPEKNAGKIIHKAMGRRVLIVDDDPDIVDILTDYIQGHGIEAIKSIAGRDALEKFHAEQPFCVITDIVMPEFNGMDLIKSIREQSPLSTIIGISGVEGRDFAEEAKQLGANHFYMKPPNLETILANIQEATQAMNCNKPNTLRAGNRD